MKHFGDITKLSGYDLPVVDVITGGSPCQDLSVAGKRAGLDGERSGLFMEQMRIVKEMRERDRANGRTGWMVRPRYMVWENVPGAFSSNGGKDFQAVLTEIARIAEPQCPDVPLPDKGRWPKAGCIYDEMGRWSIAWRVHDAQFWGVPQRRKRIALVADFGGLSAPDIVFERSGLSAVHEPLFSQRKGLSGDFEPCGEAGQETAGADGGGVEGASRCLTGWDVQSKRIFSPDGKSGTLNSGTTEGMNIVPSVLAYGISSYDSNAMKSPNPHSGIYEADTARTLDLNGGSQACNQGGIAVVQPVALCVSDVLPFDTTQVTSDKNWSNPHFGDPCHPLAAGAHPPAVAIGNGQLNQMSMAEQANTLDTMHDQQAVMVAAVDCRNGTENPDINGTLQAKSTGGIGVNFQNVCRTGAIVRRLTPLECERLQGYPDGWTELEPIVDMPDEEYEFWKNVLWGKNIRSGRIRQNEDGVWEVWRVKKIADAEDGDEAEDEWENTHKPYKHKTKKQMVSWYNRSFAGDADSPRYKALGNSIALPFWQWLARRICAQYERTVTMASLFDGIGGFPLVFQRCGAVPVWASEIEEFPIAVTKRRFPEAE